MARSVSLAAYLALARRAPPAGWSAPTGKRPAGAVIWLHAAIEDGLPALLQLADRFRSRDIDATFVITLGEGVERPETLPQGVMLAKLPPEHIAAAEAFLNHWKPDLVLWAAGDLRPAVITTAAERNIPMLLIDVEESALEEARWRWLPDMSRGIINHFEQAYARTANAGRRLQRLGLPSDRIEVTGPLQRCAPALPCDEDERAELSAALAGRQVWLAAEVQPDEVDSVISAHKQAFRATHRLMLILHPANEADGPRIARKLAAEGWRHAVWSRGELPSEATQILLADTEDQMGLWLRIAPLAFMGSSLTPAHKGADPMPAAALGAAVLSGPHMHLHVAAYTRMSSAGAALIARDAAALGSAVTRLTAPDQAAAMAHAAWELATEGAEATDMLLDRIEDALDSAGHG